MTRVETLRKSDYFEAGLDLLATRGIGGVTISALCDRLGVTKGSFYHHFTSGEDFQAKLLEYWVFDHLDLAVQVAGVDPVARLDILKLGATSLRHEAESAIRAWARTSQMAAQTLRQVDEIREEALRLSLVEAGVPKERAAQLARIGMSILIATQQREHPVDRFRLLELFDEYQCWLEWSIQSERVP
jgi:AcrR family transcriptional regulator